MLDTNQSVTGSVKYDVFGEASSASASRFLFTGRELDPETNLYYYRARMYQPKLGRFMSKDPLLFIDGPNVYGYSKNNPLRYKDPFGLDDRVADALGGVPGAINDILNISKDIGMLQSEFGAMNEAARTGEPVDHYWSDLQGRGQYFEAGVDKILPPDFKFDMRFNPPDKKDPSKK